MSGSQKALKVLSIIGIIISIIGIVISAILVVLAAIGISSIASYLDMSNSGGVVYVVATLVLALVGCIISLIAYIYGVKLSKDSSKFKPFLIFIVLSLILSIISFILGAVQTAITTSTIISLVFSIVWDVVVLILGNNIKNQQ